LHRKWVSLTFAISMAVSRPGRLLAGPWKPSEDERGKGKEDRGQ
jgi:hypothetical protein